MSSAVYNPNIDDEIGGNNETIDNEIHKYLFVYSSERCPHSKKLLRQLKKMKLNEDIEQNMTPLDIMDIIKNRQDIPEYLEYVPALIITDEDSYELLDRLYGNEILEWINKQKMTKGHTKNSFEQVVGTYAPKDYHGRNKFAVEIECDKYGKPIDNDPAQFQIPLDQNNKHVNTNDYMEYESGRNKIDEEFGIKSSVSLSMDPNRRKRTKSKGVKSFQSSNSSKSNKNGQRYAAYNA